MDGLLAKGLGMNRYSKKVSNHLMYSYADLTFKVNLSQTLIFCILE